MTDPAEKILSTALRWISFFLGLVFFAALFLLSACVTRPPSSWPENGVKGMAPQAGPVWPPPPEQPRIRWVGEIRSFGNGGSGFFGRLKEIVFGRTENLMIRPHGVYADGSGGLYVADAGAGLVHHLDTKTGAYRRIGGGDGVRLVEPIGITGDAHGNVYVTDPPAGAVYRLRPGAKTFERLTPTGFRRPTGIAWNGVDGILYVVDTGSHQVISMGPNGAERSRFGRRGTGRGEFNFPVHAACCPHGRLFVADVMNSRLQIFSADGVFLSAFGKAGDSTGSFARPKGVAVDSGDHVYVADALFDAVQVFGEDGRLLLAFGETGQGPGQFWMPSGISIDADDFIYVSDTYNQRIQIFQYLKGEAAR